MHPQEVKIVRVQLEDKNQLLEIGQQTFYDSFGPPINTEDNIKSYLKANFTLEKITQELQHPHAEFYFAKINKEVVGYIKLNRKDAQTEALPGDSLEIERIYVVKIHQGKKIGQMLFNQSLYIAKKKNVDFMWLGVWDQNPDAIRFYKRNAFKIFDKHRFVLGTEIQTDILMKREL